MNDNRGKREPSAEPRFKFYAVAKGRTVGVFLQWSQAQSSVQGFPGNSHKGFANLEAAKAFVVTGAEGTLTTAGEVPLYDTHGEPILRQFDNMDNEEMNDESLLRAVDEPCDEVTLAKMTDVPEAATTIGEERCPVCGCAHTTSDMFCCDLCESWVHYECTNIPDYYICALEDQNLRMKYICPPCASQKYNLTAQESIRTNRSSPGMQVSQPKPPVLSISRDQPVSDNNNNVDEKKIIDHFAGQLKEQMVKNQEAVVHLESQIVAELSRKRDENISLEIQKLQGELKLQRAENYSLHQENKRAKEQLKTISETPNRDSDQTNRERQKEIAKLSAVNNQLSLELEMCREEIKQKDNFTKKLNEIHGNEMKLVETHNRSLQKVVREKNCLLQIESEKLVEARKLVSSLQEEAASLKRHIPTDVNPRPNDAWQVTQRQRPNPKAKCDLLLMGSSQIKDIQPDRISSKFATHEVTTYTLEDVRKAIEEWDGEAPKVLGIHCMFNNLKNNTPQVCADEMNGVLTTAQSKWPNTKTVVFCHNANLNSTDKFEDDKIHLRESGASILASNIKHAVLDVLNLKSHEGHSSNNTSPSSPSSSYRRPYNTSPSSAYRRPYNKSGYGRNPQDYYRNDRSQKHYKK